MVNFSYHIFTYFYSALSIEVIEQWLAQLFFLFFLPTSFISNDTFLLTIIFIFGLLKV